MAVEEDLPNWVVGVVEGHLQYQVVAVVVIDDGDG